LIHAHSSASGIEQFDHLECIAVVSSALRLIGVIASGETIDISTANDSLTAFNQMLDSWNSDRLAIFTTGFQDFPWCWESRPTQWAAAAISMCRRPLESMA